MARLFGRFGMVSQLCAHACLLGLVALTTLPLPAASKRPTRGLPVARVPGTEGLDQAATLSYVSRAEKTIQSISRRRPCESSPIAFMKR